MEDPIFDLIKFTRHWNPITQAMWPNDPTNGACHYRILFLNGYGVDVIKSPKNDIYEWSLKVLAWDMDGNLGTTSIVDSQDPRFIPIQGFHTIDHWKLLSYVDNIAKTEAR